MDHSLSPMDNHAMQSAEGDNLSASINQHMFASLGGPVDSFYSQPSVNGVLVESAPANEYSIVAPTVTAFIGYHGPRYSTSTYVASDLGASSTSHSQEYSGYASSRMMLLRKVDKYDQIIHKQFNNRRRISYFIPHQYKSNVDVETIPTGQNPDPELQHEFLQFLMDNHRLLNSITNPTDIAITSIQNEFAKDIQSRGLCLPSSTYRR
ncbi:hypothetical protein BJ912DRAFT_921765 [Pholiota molesta]|nr:hypothetical protein BJ912DRAFT_921765 [Pholiota molesta]